MDTLPSEPTPDWGMNVETNARVLRADFGDGYSQRTGDGLNTMPDTISLTYSNISKADWVKLVAFFKSKRGVEAFLFTVPGLDAPQKWTCTKWSWKPVAAGLFTLTATLKEEFDL